MIMKPSKTVIMYSASKVPVVTTTYYRMWVQANGNVTGWLRHLSRQSAPPEYRAAKSQTCRMAVRH